MRDGSRLCLGCQSPGGSHRVLTGRSHRGNRRRCDGSLHDHRHAPQRRPRAATPSARPRRGHPRAQRGARPRTLRPAPARLPLGRAAVRLPHHRRRQREHRPDPGRRSPAGRCPARRRRGPPRREGPGSGTARGLVGVRRSSPGLHGRRPLHRPRRPAASRRAAGVRALRPGDRLPPGPRRPRGPRHQARGHLPRLQPGAPHDARRPVQRRAVRLQGHPERRGRPAPPPGRGRRVVLRHRAPGAGRAERAAHPRGARRLGRRPGQQRRHHQHRARRPARCDPARPRAGDRGAPPGRGPVPARSRPARAAHRRRAALA